MPKPLSERKTSNPLGVKINSVMREKGIEGDYGGEVRCVGVADGDVLHGRSGACELNPHDASVGMLAMAFPSALSMRRSMA